MKKQLIVILVLLLIFICYYWLTQYNKSIETYVNNTTKVYIHNVDDAGNVKTVLDQTNIVEAMHIKTFEGHDVEVVIGEGIEEINGFFTNDLLLLMKNHITKVQFPSTLTKIGPNEFNNYTKLGNVILPAGLIDIGPNAFRGTAITSVNLPQIITSKEEWNHTADDINTWSSIRPFIIKNGLIHFASGSSWNDWNPKGNNNAKWIEGWVIVYNNNYYPIFAVHPSIKCGVMDIPGHDDTKFYYDGDRGKGRNCGGKLSWGWNNVYEHNRCAKMARCCECKGSTTVDIYNPNTGQRTAGNNLHKYKKTKDSDGEPYWKSTNGDKIEYNTNGNRYYGWNYPNNRLFGTMIDNNWVTDNDNKYIFISSQYGYNKIALNTIDDSTLRGIRTAYQNNLYPFDDSVDVIFNDETGHEEQEYADPKTTHIQTIEDYITNTENNQLAGITMMGDLYKVQFSGKQLTKESIIIDYPDYINQEIIYILDDATHLTSELFREHPNLKTIVITHTVLSIESSCFESCPNLENVFFYPVSQLISIGNRAFANCTSLKTIHLPDSLLSIGFSAFEGCSGLQVFINPSSELKVIAMNAFASDIQSLILPSNAHFAPLNHDESGGIPAFVNLVNNLTNNLCMLLTTNLITTTKHTDRYITQSVLDYDDFTKTAYDNRDRLLGTDGKTINNTKYTNKNTYNIYQNKITNKVFITNKTNNTSNDLYKYRYVFYERDLTDKEEDAAIAEFEVWNTDNTRISHTLNPKIIWSSRWNDTGYNYDNINDGSLTHTTNEWHSKYTWTTAATRRNNAKTLKVWSKDVYGSRQGTYVKSFIGYDFGEHLDINKIKLTACSGSGNHKNLLAGTANDRAANKNGYKLYFTNYVYNKDNYYKWAKSFVPYEYTCVDPTKPFITISSKDAVYVNDTYTHDNIFKNIKYFITVPFQLDYYLDDISSAIITNQSTNIEDSKKRIREAEKIVSDNIDSAENKINTINGIKTGIFNLMNNAVYINGLPSLETVNTHIGNINTYLKTATDNNILNEYGPNNTFYTEQIANLTTLKEALETEINDKLAENTKRINDRLIHEQALIDAENKHIDDIEKLKTDANTASASATTAWFNQYKIENDTSELDNNISTFNDNIQEYNNSVVTNVTLNSLKQDLNVLNEVYQEEDDVKTRKISDKNLFNSRLYDVQNEKELKQEEIKNVEEEHQIIFEENENIKNRLKNQKIKELNDHIQNNLKYTNNKIKIQEQHGLNMYNLSQDKTNKTELLKHGIKEGEKISENQGELIENTIQEQKQYEPFMNINRFNFEYLDPKFEDYKLNQEDCNQLLTTFDAEQCNEEEYKCIQKEICENRNLNNQLENEIYKKPGTKKRFKDSKENYHYNYTNTVHMSLGILTLLTIIYKIK